jgi:uncharacterized protein
MQCPVCVDELLRISERQGIEIDYCPRCRGVWLDRGELDKLIERTQHFPHTPALPPVTMPEVRKRKNDNKYAKRSPIEQYTDRDDDRYERGRRPYRQKPTAKKVKDFLEDIFDVFD